MTAISPVNPNQLFDAGKEPTSTLTEFRKVLESGQLFRYRDDGQPPPSAIAEQLLSRRLDKESAMLVANGTVGLELALRALGVGAGDLVGVCAYSFIACSMAVANIGAVPVPLDISDDLTMRPPADDDDLAAVLVVHLQGHAIDAAEVFDWCAARNVPVVEDICQGLGAEYPDGAPAGARGRIAVTSFQHSKQVSAGEGGAVIGSAADLERVQRLCDLGAVRGADGLPDWNHPDATFGSNARLSELQAALVLDQLVVLDETIRRQRANRSLLWEMIPHQFQGSLSSLSRSWQTGSHSLIVMASGAEAERFIAELRERRVFARTVWQHTFPEYAVFRHALPTSVTSTALSGAKRLAPRLVSIPTSKYLDAKAIAHLCDAIGTTTIGGVHEPA